MVSHGVGHPDWSHRSYGIVVEDEALDIFLFAAETPASILDLYTQLTGKAPAVPRWSLGLWVSRAYYQTPEEAIAVAARLRERKIPADVLTLDGRAAWKVETRFDFEWDPERFSDPRASIAAIKKHAFKVCVWEYPYVSVNSPLFQELAARHYLLMTDHGDPYVFGWDTSPNTSPFGSVLTPLPESGILDFTNRTFVFSNAGQNPPLLMKSDGEYRYVEYGDVPLGMFDDSRYHQHFIRFDPGQVMVIYTDGITEAANANGEEYGQDRLAKRVLEGIQDDLRAKQLIDHVRKGVADFTERKFLDDDGTLFIVKAE